ncbi:MAG: PH domain-containing protein [Actinomycetia bacterium]|nr:PH domain-containing protein [Actinomycetes bacterium]
MSFPQANLNDDEQVVLDLRPHWWYFAPQVSVLTLVLVIGVLSLVLELRQEVQLAVAVIILVVLVWFLVRYAVWTTTNFVITTDRLINRSGVLRRQGIEIPLERVNTVFFKQTLFERIIGSGDLIIESAGEQGAQLVDDIRRPLNVQNEIYRQMEHNENRKFDRINRHVAAPSSASIPDQIEKLADLYRQGVLTESEFQQKKTELLDRL